MGHYATGLIFTAQKQGGKITFFLLVLGTQFVDLLWGLFILLDIEGGNSGGSVEQNFFDFPWSHSLLMMVVWSVLYGFATNYYVTRNIDGINNFGIIAGLSVFSHWVLDFIVHNDDMRIIPTDDSTVPSLYLWEFPIAAFFVELVIILASWEYYLKGIKKDQGDELCRKKPLILLALMALLHLLFFLPSFSDTNATEATAATGVGVMILVPLIAAIMTWVHPDQMNKSNS